MFTRFVDNQAKVSSPVKVGNIFDLALGQVIRSISQNCHLLSIKSTATVIKNTAKYEHNNHQFLTMFDNKIKSLT